LHDLLYFFPRAYEDRTNSKNIVNLLQDEFAAVRGVIINVTTQYIKAGRTMFKAILKDDTGIMELVWFNNRYIKSYIKIGDELLVYGKAKKSAKFQMVNPEYKRIQDGIVKGSLKYEQIMPIYPSVASLRQEAIRKIINDALLDYGYLLEENIPEELLRKG